MPVAGKGAYIDPPPTYVERDLRKYLECGILAHGLVRARCEQCAQEFLVAYSWEGCGGCAACNTGRMMETVAQSVEHVFPAVAGRQWLVVLPKRLRYLLRLDASCLNWVMGIAIRAVECATARATTSTAAAARTGGVQFVHCFGAALNAHVHLHLCMLTCEMERMIGRAASVCCDIVHARCLLVRGWCGLQVGNTCASEFLDRTAGLYPPPRKNGSATWRYGHQTRRGSTVWSEAGGG